MSVDIDFNDFYVLNEILANYQCDIIICEYNSTYLADEDKIVLYDKNGKWDGSNYFGVSLLALVKLGKLSNYSLVYCDKRGVNCFFIHNNIIENKGLKLKLKDLGDIEKLYMPAQYGFGPNGGHPQDPHSRQYVSFDDAMKI